jgi:formate dehydrogenase major subunit
MLDAAVDGFKGIYIQGEDILQSVPTPNTLPLARCHGMRRRHDLFLNETANYAHVFLRARPSRKTAPSPTQSAALMVRKVLEPGATPMGGDAGACGDGGAELGYQHPSEIMDEVAKTTPSFAGVSFELPIVSDPCSGPAKAPLAPDAC